MEKEEEEEEEHKESTNISKPIGSYGKHIKQYFPLYNNTYNLYIIKLPIGFFLYL